MREYIVTYKYISKMFREKTRTFSFMYNEDIFGDDGKRVPLSVQIISGMYKDLADTYDVDRTDGFSIAVDKIWYVNENGEVNAC